MTTKPKAKAKPKLTAGQRQIRDLARDVGAKCVRLRNNAALVAGDPTPGRNLTTLRTTAADMLDLLHAILDQRCRVCGCTDDDCSGCVKKTGGPCAWVGADLCSACVEGPTP